jgi:hypothetical protein
MRRLTVLSIDVLILVLFGLALGIALTGGGVWIYRGARISARAPDNVLVALTMLLAIRYGLREWGPFLGRARWSAAAIHLQALRVLGWFRTWSDAVTPHRGSRFVVGFVLSAIVLKAALAWAAPGFFSGDDVEVQEMSLGALRHTSWPVWDLRNAIFPLTVTYPSQRVAAAVGWTQMSSLVWAGRLPVAVLSSLGIWLVWRIGRLEPARGAGWAVLAAFLFATNQLQIAFGSSELPRPVSTVLILAGYLAMQRGSLGGVFTSAVLIGVAACLRFSEVVFVVPAALQLLTERRLRDATLFGAVVTGTIAMLLGLADLWYWGQPFHSLVAIIDYTMVRGLSSRGYQNVFWYGTHAYQWVNPALFVLAIVTTVRARPREAFWAWVPVVLLSALPHKEARYLIPVIPFVCLLATRAVRDLSRQLSDAASRERPWVPLSLIAGLTLGLVLDIGHWRLPRTNADVALAQVLAVEIPADRALVIQQAWRLGGHLYFDSRPIVDLDPALMADPLYVSSRTPAGAWSIVDSRGPGYAAVRADLVRRSYQERVHTTASTYRVWQPSE